VPNAIPESLVAHKAGVLFVRFIRPLFTKHREIMKLRRSGTGTSVLALSIIAVVLAAAFVYYYATTESQISTLKQSGHSFCLAVNAALSSLSTTFSNITLSLQGQIQNDNSLIAALNSTKPAGYEGMIATLNAEIKQDLAIAQEVAPFVSDFNHLAEISPVNTFCASVS